MRGRPVRFPWFRIRRRDRGGKGHPFLAVLLCACLALTLLHRLDRALRPQLIALEEARLVNQLNLISAETVTRLLNEQALSYTDMVYIKLGPSGEIQALSTDTVRLNLLHAAIMESVIFRISALDSRSLGVPLGVFSGFDILSALGPVLPVRVVSVTSADRGYRNEFTGAGINQTLHRIFLDVDLRVKLLLPGGVEEIPVMSSVCVAETVILGQVPQTYLNCTM